ncbi:MAG: flagellar hook-basal body complex protein [Desulfamplus sp.]|nr:flagellar hook-basal body complex protein [Desulfamplus sp.]
MKADGYGFSLTCVDPPTAASPNGWSITYDQTLPLTLVHPFDGTAVAPPGMPNYGVAGLGLPPVPPVAAGTFGVYVLPGSDTQNVKIDLNGDGECDLEIKLDKVAVTGNEINFDICAEQDIHVQGVAGDFYQGETEDGNTTIQINDPTVMTKDVTPNPATPQGIVWYDALGVWGWGTMTAPTINAGGVYVPGVPTPAVPVTTPTAAVAPAFFAAYPNATISGDKEKAIINLDGSTGTNNREDIVFDFATPLANNSSIYFNINGSNAWTTVDKPELEETGYFNFKTDFLGGEFGGTESMIQLNMGTQYVNQTFTKDAMSTTQFAKASTTVYQDADGYAAGSLEGVDISTDGTITGVYSNGELLPLFRVGLAKFLNNNGLFSVGGNLFRETRDSGSAITNKPGENGLGTLSPNSLEMSNVDISEEFVNMITTQRAFQANSKTVTTVDDMLNTVIGMKR